MVFLFGSGAGGRGGAPGPRWRRQLFPSLRVSDGTVSVDVGSVDVGRVTLRTTNDGARAVLVTAGELPEPALAAVASAAPAKQISRLRGSCGCYARATATPLAALGRVKRSATQCTQRQVLFAVCIFSCGGRRGIRIGISIFEDDADVLDRNEALQKISQHPHSVARMHEFRHEPGHVRGLVPRVVLVLRQPLRTGSGLFLARKPRFSPQIRPAATLPSTTSCSLPSDNIIPVENGFP